MSLLQNPLFDRRSHFADTVDIEVSDSGCTDYSVDLKFVVVLINVAVAVAEKHYFDEVLFDTLLAAGNRSLELPADSSAEQNVKARGYNIG
mmetsp:Transcript_21162/g.31383  ORF Transcript_21162/g.31383 Transcript_21162/m.31383 type:complete len:91 (+) Transcript_21162:4025-4297(+)